MLFGKRGMLSRFDAAPTIDAQDKIY